jgi:hypothetical protein
VVITTLLLDEVGLAEHSPLMPLKVRDSWSSFPSSASSSSAASSSSSSSSS